MSDENKAVCAHMTVKYDPIDHGNSRFTERWRCTDCQLEFCPGKILDRMITAAFPEQKRIRDEFAMAALTGDMGRAGVWAETLPGHAGNLYAAKIYYEIADAMLEARKL